MGLYEYLLLIEKYKEEITRMVANHNVVIIKGPTGCGKSTYIPWLFKDHRVAVIEPRRIAVMSIYNTLKEHIPQLGYKMRFAKKTDKNTKVCLYTDGCFLNECAQIDYDYIIIDEVHERSLRMDVLIGILLQQYKKKLILMSATLDTKKLESICAAKTFVIPGKSFPLQINYLQKPTSDYISEAYFTIKNILKQREKNEKKDILVFMPGEEDIAELGSLCARIPGTVVYKIYSSMSDNEQMRVYDESTQTKVILSTNICETSLTLPNIKYVVDTGLYKTKIYDGMHYFGIQAISSNSAEQRAGRCNRIGPGVCYRLYEESYILPLQKAEISRSDLSTVFLSLLSLGKNIFDFKYIDYPPIANCISALEFLHSKQCIQIYYDTLIINKQTTFPLSNCSSEQDPIDSLGKVVIKITPYGRKLARHPFDTQYAHLYEQCIMNGLGAYGAALLTLISQDRFNFMSPGPKTQPDILHLIDIFFKYKEAENKPLFCRKNEIPARGMALALKMISGLSKNKDGEASGIEKIFSACFSHNLYFRNDDGSYSKPNSEESIFIHPTSYFFKKQEKKIVCVDVVNVGKAYARIVGKYHGV
ncbi:ATP-dependent RNA helicase DHX8/PRP22 [Enteropsectra breve]|nr:ATP-dependent RNA helicase DHX8/PRP22 [Enteropsectra breve]